MSHTKDAAYTHPESVKFNLLTAEAAEAAAAAHFDRDPNGDIGDYCLQPLPEAVIKAIADKGQELTLVDLLTIIALNGGDPYRGEGYTPLSAIMAVSAGFMTDIATALLLQHDSHCQGTLQHFGEYMDAMQLNAATAAGNWHLGRDDNDALRQRVKYWYDTRLRANLPQDAWERVAAVLTASADADSFYKGTEKRPDPVATLLRQLGWPEDEIEKIVNARGTPQTDTKTEAEAGAKTDTKTEAGAKTDTKTEAGAKGQCRGQCQGCSCHKHD